MAKLISVLKKGSIKCFAAFLVSIACINIVYANVVITEVMYDLDGNDTDRECVEIYHDGSDDIDLAEWRFVVGGTKHTFLAYPEGGNVVLPAGTYAVVVDKPEVFLADWPGFSGKILDSSFSLKQAGDTLSIRNPDGVDVDTVQYDPSVGGGGDGTTLQKSGGQWIAALPTPGAMNATHGYAPPASSEDGTAGTSGTSSGAQTTSMMADDSEKHITAKIDLGFVGNTKTIVVGADTLFKGKAFGFDGTPLLAPRYSWTFGDGGTKEGEQVLYHYRYPGTYIVVLNVSSGEYTAADRVKIDVVAADVVIASTGTGADSFVELKNDSSYELDLSWWRIRNGNTYFTLPKGTIIVPKGVIILPPENTRFSIGVDNTLDLLYPNGEIAHTYSRVPPPISSSQTALRPPVVSTVAVAEKKVAIPVMVGSAEPLLAEKSVSAEDIVQTQPAEVVVAIDSAGGSGKWVFAVAGLSLISIVAIIAGRRRGMAHVVTNEADEYKILE